MIQTMHQQLPRPEFGDLLLFRLSPPGDMSTVVEVGSPVARCVC